MRTTKLCRWTAVAALAITAAGGASAASASEEAAELRLWGGSSGTAEDEALNDLLDQYEAESGVTITFEPQPEFDTALQAALSAGDPPDFFYVDSSDCRISPMPGARPNPRGDHHRARRHLPVTHRGIHLRRHVVLPAEGLLHARPRLQRRHARSRRRRATDQHGRARRRRRGADQRRGRRAGLRSRTRPRGVFMLANGGYIVNEDVSEMTLDTEENRAALQYLADMFAAGHTATPAECRGRMGRRGLRAGQGGHGHRGQLGRRRLTRTSRTSTGPSPSCRRARPVGDVRVHRVLQRRRRVGQPRGLLGGDRLPHRSRGGRGMDG